MGKSIRLRRSRAGAVAIQIAVALAVACGGDPTDPDNPPLPGPGGPPPGGQTPPPADALTITSLVLPEGLVDDSYAVTLEATGGTPPYTWGELTPLPNGLSLNPDGRLTGTLGYPAGPHQFEVQVTDAEGEQVSADMSLLLRSASRLRVTTVALRVGDAFQPYADTLRAEGGSPPYTFVWGAPSGLTLDPATGAISGSPLNATGAQGEPREKLVTVRDVVGASAIARVALGIRPAPLRITTDIPNARIGANYHFYHTWEGGFGPTPAFSIVSGSLPTGLSLSVSTLYGPYLGGIANTVGTFHFTMQATTGGFTATRDYTVVISDEELLIVTSTLPDADVGAPYSVVLVRDGGTDPFTWDVVSGSAPSRISLSPVGALIGTPSEAGTASFTVRVQDSGGQSDTQGLTLQVGP